MSGPKPRPARGGLFFFVQDMIAPDQNPNRIELDPGVFDDPMVDQTAWTLMDSAGSNFTSFRLTQPAPKVFKFKATHKARAFSLIVGGIGLVIIVATLIQLLKLPAPPWGDAMPALMIGGLMIAGTSYLMLHLEQSILFDFAAGTFYRRHSRRAQKWLNDRRAECQFADIYALQILPALYPGESTMYWVFELNLVLKDGSRQHVLSHGGVDDIRADAAALAEALNCPLWDCSVQVD